jgi:hypothetical protein
MPSIIEQSGTTQGKPWQQYPGGDGIFIDVSTAPHEFPGIPIYNAVLYGSSAHWATTGVTSIYNASPTGFRVYIRQADGGPLTPADAVANGWYVRWVGTFVDYTYPQ